jgi:hypothetical protein
VIIRLAAVAVAGPLAGLLIGCAHNATASPWSGPGRTGAQVTAVRPAPRQCAAAAPTTAVGYTRLFAVLPRSQWAAADVSISVALPDGRVVWLYGDTLSTGRFAHSTAIVQDRGCLHVSRGGAQLLPNDDAHHIYWIESAHVISASRLNVTARSIVMTGTCVWCFRDGGSDRSATVAVSPAGDLTFQRWGAKHAAPPPSSTGFLPGTTQLHYLYDRHTHPEAKLAGGKMLITTCQNWSTLHPAADYRPTFTAISTIS